MVVTWTYNAGTNTATASGAGSTNFAALVAADTAGGWGKFSADATGTQIICKAKIIAGDGTNALTWTDTEKQVLFDAVCTGGNQIDFYVQSNAVVTFGILINATTKTTSSGCAFRSTDNYTGCRIIEAVNSATAIFNLYSCFLETSYGGSGTWSYLIPSKNCNIYNTQLAKNVFLAYGRGNYYNVIVTGADKGVYQLPATMDKMVLTGNRMALYPQTGTATYTVKNTKIVNETYTVVYSASNATVNLVNCESDTWHFYFASAASARCNRQYEFDVETDVSATVTLKNAAGANVFSVSSDGTTGKIATQTVSRGYYDQANGDTLQDYGPFTLTISKAGYIPYVHSGIVLDEKIDWRISLHPQLSGDATEADVATGKTFYKDDADTQLTGTLIPVIQTISGGVDGKTRVVVRREKDPLLIPSLMANAALLIENKRLRRKTS